MTNNRLDIPLPSSTGGDLRSLPGTTRQVTIIGGNGAGKSRFMEEMTGLCGNRAFVLSALSAAFPEREESGMAGSVDDLYRHATAQRPYMRGDAVSELDKLTYMLFVDELETLISFKESFSAKRSAEGEKKGKKGDKEKKPTRLPESRLDRIKRLWEEIFPGNRISCENGTLRFANTSGEDLIGVSRLSQGEKTVLYYAAAVLYAMPSAVIFIDSPSLFLHPSIIGTFWNAIEQLRPDCTFVYNSVDVDFVNTRGANTCIWVKSYEPATNSWDYEILPDSTLSEELFVELAGSRRPVLFIEGDSRHSIDARLYSLVFSEWTVRPLGSCNKVIETTRTFNDLKNMHHLRSRGIVDRDRRTEAEVGYLRRKEIMVPEVAEVENIFMMEEVIKGMARRRGKDPERIFARVKREVIRMFKRHADEQALQHVRHRVKREVECKIDARFTCITALETHLKTLVFKLQPRKNYNQLRQEFAAMVVNEDYAGILRVFNHKPMLPGSEVHQLLGYRSKDDYISGVLDALKEGGKEGERLRASIRHCFGIDGEETI